MRRLRVALLTIPLALAALVPSALSPIQALAATPYNSQIDVITTGQSSGDNQLERHEFTLPTWWLGWQPMNYDPSRIATGFSPALSKRDGNTEDVFVTDTNGMLQHGVISPAVSAPSPYIESPLRLKQPVTPRI